METNEQIEVESYINMLADMYKTLEKQMCGDREQPAFYADGWNDCEREIAQFCGANDNFFDATNAVRLCKCLFDKYKEA